MITFHPDPEFPRRLYGIAAQADVLVVDNGSSDAEVLMLRRACTSASATLVCNGANLGVAQALNVGCARALAGGYAWALLLDQDTEVDPDIVSRLLQTHESCPDGERVAIVGSLFRDTSGRAPGALRLEGRGEHWNEVESVITSGSLLSLRAYAAIGAFREEFFIDHVDTEFCFRARAAGYRVIQTRQPLMSHTVGTTTAHPMLWATKWTTHHAAQRRYYIARNDTVILKEFGTSGLGPWQLKSFFRSFRLVKRIALYETDKLRKIAAVAQGWWHGVRGKMGPRP